MQADCSKYHEARTWLTCTLAAAPVISSRARRKVLSPYLYPEEQDGRDDDGPDGGREGCDSRGRQAKSDDGVIAQRDSVEGSGTGAGAAVSTFGPKEAQMAMIELLCEQRRAEVWGGLVSTPDLDPHAHIPPTLPAGSPPIWLNAKVNTHIQCLLKAQTPAVPSHCCADLLIRPNPPPLLSPQSPPLWPTAVQIY